VKERHIRRTSKPLHPNHGMVCDQNIDELRRVYNRKFPHKIQALERFLALALTVLEVVPTPAVDVSDEALVRDVPDRLILRAAVAARADVLVTGDRDFLESGVTNPKIVTAAEFLQME
jgi:predicted nucleic acid-binding protein